MNKIKICCICGEGFIGWGNNPWPVKDEGECCDVCNSLFVVPARIKKMVANESKQKMESEIR